MRLSELARKIGLCVVSTRARCLELERTGVVTIHRGRQKVTIYAKPEATINA